jgi:hypothetical protein
MIWYISKHRNNRKIKLYFKKYWLILRKVICEAKIQDYNQLIETSNNKNKTFSNIIKNMLHKSAVTVICCLHLRQMTRTFNLEIQLIFNEYFLNIADNLQTHTDKIISPIGLLKNAYQTFLDYGSNPCNQRRTHQYNSFYKINDCTHLKY